MSNEQKCKQMSSKRSSNINEDKIVNKTSTKTFTKESRKALYEKIQKEIKMEAYDSLKVSTAPKYFEHLDRSYEG